MAERCGYAEAYGRVSAELELCRPQFGLLRVLEAGGGSASHVALPSDVDMTVIDMSPEQLARNGARTKILGDLHSVEMKPAAYDMVVCWNVIEHLKTPGAVIDKFVGTVRPGGLIVLAWPDRASLAGLFTRLTPHAFHVLALRHIFGMKDAGAPGRPPFKTFHRPEIGFDRIIARAADNGLEVAYAGRYEGNRFAKLCRRPVLGPLYRLTARLGKAALGRDLRLSDIMLVLRRPC